MDITYNGWSLSLDLNGGRIRELLYNGVRVFGTYERIDGKVGNTHICVPSFDKEGQEKYALPFHGLVRNIPWEITKKSNTILTISCKTLSLIHYPATLFVEQEFNLENNFIHTVRVTNRQGKEVPVNIGCHYYWDTPMGWEKTLINNSHKENDIKTNSYMNLSEKNTISFPHTSYELTSLGYHSAVLWTSFKEGKKSEKKFSKNFCCIEPVIGWPGYFGTEASILNPGKTVSASIQIKKVV